MTFNEFKVLAKGMKAVYTSPNFLPDRDSVGIWYELLKDLPYELANIAIQKHMTTNKFAPTPAEIRAAAVDSVKKAADWASGWSEFISAVRKYGYNRPEEALASMSDATRQTVERLGFRALCESENTMQDRANFRMVYEQEAQRTKEAAAIPISLKAAIERLQQGGGECEKRIAEFSEKG